jgi:hypothetical protein
MDVRHLGLYAYESGFEILRHGRIKAHNGIIARQPTSWPAAMIGQSRSRFRGEA